jgi:hypothetical protein
VILLVYNSYTQKLTCIEEEIIQRKNLEEFKKANKASKKLTIAERDTQNTGNVTTIKGLLAVSMKSRSMLNSYLRLSVYHRLTLHKTGKCFTVKN